MQLKIPHIIIQFIKIYFISIVFFTTFRIILFFTKMDLINSSVEFKDIVLSFLMGIRFDIVISSYVLSLPVVILSICSILKIQSVIIFNIITYYIITLFSIAFLVSAIDIPYFNQFFSRNIML